MKKGKDKQTKLSIPNEDRVRNAVVGYIVGNGYTRKLTVKANNQQGVDIYAEHGKHQASRILIEAKGYSPGTNVTQVIYDAWGQLMSRITSVNANRIHGLAFPSAWIENVWKLSSTPVGKLLNVHYFFVDSRGVVTEYTANQFDKIDDRKNSEGIDNPDGKPNKKTSKSKKR